MSSVDVRGGSGKDPAQIALFMRLYTQDRGFVLGVPFRHGVPKRDLEDAVQDAYVTVLRRLSVLDPTRTARPWLHVIAVYTALNYRSRARHRREEYPGEVPEVFAHEECADALLISHEDNERLRTRVSRLRPKLRAVVVPYVFEGRLISEIAASLKIPEKTAYARLRLAREALARHARSSVIA
jgi:RNA polymerase sigma-70 factor, ECF subfamily